MPWGDGTGPSGMGPMTGRGAGFCAGFPVPGYTNPLPRGGFGRGWGRGFGRGGGRGFGWRRWTGNYPAPYYSRSYYPTQPIPVSPVPIRFQPQIRKEDEIQFLQQDIKALEEEKKYLEDELVSIRKRLEELKK